MFQHHVAYVLPEPPLQSVSSALLLLLSCVISFILLKVVSFFLSSWRDIPLHDQRQDSIDLVRPVTSCFPSHS